MAAPWSNTLSEEVAPFSKRTSGRLAEVIQVRGLVASVNHSKRPPNRIGLDDYWQVRTPLRPVFVQIIVGVIVTCGPERQEITNIDTLTSFKDGLYARSPDCNWNFYGPAGVIFWYRRY